MPIYEFKCPKCNKVFEELAKQGEKVKCEKCKVRTKKLFSNFGFVSSGKSTTSSCNTCSVSTCDSCK